MTQEPEVQDLTQEEKEALITKGREFLATTMPDWITNIPEGKQALETLLSDSEAGILTAIANANSNTRLFACLSANALCAAIQQAYLVGYYRALDKSLHKD